jgi:hypothetical protein
MEGHFILQTSNMTPTDPYDLPLWGLDNQKNRLESPGQWPDDVFLFRVWYDGPSKVKLDPDNGFVAHRPADSMPLDKELQSQVYHHVDHKGLNTHTSSFISTTLSFPWALVNAKKIPGEEPTHGKPIKISIIQASALDRATMIIAFDHLPRRPPLLLHKFEFPNYEDNLRFANHSQEVLVFNRIPASAVLGTVEFQAHLQKAPELPWVTYDTTLIPRRYQKAYPHSVWEYTEHWARTFRQNLLSGDLSLDKHASNSLDLALRLLNASVSTAARTSQTQTPGRTKPKEKDPVLNLAAYLFLWPFREQPAQSKGLPLPEVQTPSDEEVVQKLQECREKLKRRAGNVRRRQSKGGGHSQDNADKLASAMAKVSISGDKPRFLLSLRSTVHR